MLAWMPTSFLALLVLASLRRTSAGGKLFMQSQNVRELNPDTVEHEVVASKTPWVVMYYADWCPHCHHYAPTFEQIALRLTHKSPVQFGAFNCPDFNAFCMKIQVSGYPTVRTYHFKGDSAPGLAGSTPDRAMVHNADKFSEWITKHQPRLQLPPSLPSGGDSQAASSSAMQQAASPELALAEGSPGLRGAAETASVPAQGATVAASHGEAQSPEMLREAATALHLVDAEVALLYTLRQGTFLRGDAGVLKGEPLLELLRWLDFVGHKLPSRAARRDLQALAEATHEAAAASSAGSALEQAVFEKLLDERGIDRVPPQAGIKPEAYWRSCSSYTCGLWTLFHMLSQARGSAPDTIGEELLARIRGFVANFFGCEYCMDHFLQAFDLCQFDRCKLLADDREGAALWLWKVHNDVTVRVAAESGRPMPTLWPSRKDCSICWTSDVSGLQGQKTLPSYDQAAVGVYLRSEYWSQEWSVEENESVAGSLHWLSDHGTVSWALPIASLAALSLALVAARLLKNNPMLEGEKATKGS